MNYNYHTHTTRCRHASDTPEEYINRAIACGIKHMGFSDHFPFIFPDGYESAFRVPVSEVKEYVDELSALREKYKGQIEIKIGFEMEYYPTYFDTMLKNAIAYGAEYLILGQHFIYEEHPNGGSSLAGTDNEADLLNYTSSLIAAIKSGVFTYLAHPDIFCFTGDKAVYEREIRKVCAASVEYNIPLEINFLGIRGHRIYPNEVFWKIVGEEKAPVTFGFDAHDCQNAFDSASLPKAEKLVETYQLNYIGMPTIIDIRKIKQ